MARKNSDLEADVYGEEYSVEELQAIRRRLAKRANNQLRDLSRNASPITGEVYNTYGAAVDALDYLKKRDRRYFSETLKMTRNKNVLKAEIRRLQKFIPLPSATSAGQRAIEEKRIATFAKHGISFASNKEFYDFLKSEEFHGLKTGDFSSDTIVELYERGRVKNKLTEEEINTRFNRALEAFRKPVKEGGVKATIKNLRKFIDNSLTEEEKK